MSERPSQHSARRDRRRRLAPVLLALPVIGLMAVPVYPRVKPTLWSLPFFVWYQLAWVLLAPALIALIYLARR